MSMSGDVIYLATFVSVRRFTFLKDGVQLVLSYGNRESHCVLGCIVIGGLSSTGVSTRLSGVTSLAPAEPRQGCETHPGLVIRIC
jgi:hypothetical protein